MTRSGAAIGRPRRHTALTTVKNVLLTPMPSASARTATDVKPRSFASSRTANRTSCEIFWSTTAFPSFRVEKGEVEKQSRFELRCAFEEARDARRVEVSGPRVQIELQHDPPAVDQSASQIAQKEGPFFGLP